jgi:hypothetical protein
MRAVKPSVTKLAAAVAAALALAGCARSFDMSLASLHQTPEFDFLLYQDGWACLSQGAPGRDAGGSSCAPNSGRQLRELFAQRSAATPLRDYLTDNGASCRAGEAATTCSYVKTVETPDGFARVAPAAEERVELTVTFPAKDQNLAPEQIRTALRRVSRAL